MQTLYATCGLAFSGKTTFAKGLAQALDIPRISLDDINEERGLNGGEGMTDEQWETTSQIAVDRLGNILASGQSLVLDDTLSHRFLRDRYRNVAALAGARFVLLFVDIAIADIAQRIERNRRDPVRQDIADDVFAEHAKRFQRPTADEQSVTLTSTSDIKIFLASLTNTSDW